MSVLPASTPRLGVTGHRSRDFDRNGARWCQEQLHRVIARLRSEHDGDSLNSGMANGTDLWAAVAAFDLGIHVDAWLPFPAEYQNRSWKRDERRLHQALLAKCREVNVTGSLPEPGNASVTRSAMLDLYHKRNTQLVEHSDVLIACWSGRRHGGTWHAITQAIELAVPMIVVNIRDLTVTAQSAAQVAARTGYQVVPATAA